MDHVSYAAGEDEMSNRNCSHHKNSQTLDKVYSTVKRTSKQDNSKVLNGRSIDYGPKIRCCYPRYAKVEECASTGPG